jgi:hypothetical protein
MIAINYEDGTYGPLTYTLPRQARALFDVLQREGEKANDVHNDETLRAFCAAMARKANEEIYRQRVLAFVDSILTLANPALTPAEVADRIMANVHLVDTLQQPDWSQEIEKAASYLGELQKELQKSSTSRANQ